MKVVCLLSGGKDSVYNLIHSIINDHTPLALASLAPPPLRDEIDSYMYQTVGHSGLATIAQALNLPLFTHEIKGTAVNQEGEYGQREGGKGKGTEGDETEDMYELLNKVKAAMPEVQGVACGAILSNYQRVRVEHVCSRLGLTPIAYLWERDQKELLSEMVDAGMESVLVKVAGAGLQVEHLGQSLAQMQPTLLRLNKRYELHPCGEGGEYETFTVDCPLYTQRVNFDKTTTVLTDPSPWSTIAHLHLDACSLVPKPSHPQNESFEQVRDRLRKLVRVPSVLDELSEDVEERVKIAYATEPGRELAEGKVELVEELEAEEWRAPQARRTEDGWLHFAGVSAPPAETSLSLDDEVRACFTALIDLLSAHSLSLLHLTHLTLYLSPALMPQFASINAIYSTYFGTSPPTRACVGVALPKGRRLELEGVARVEDGSAVGRKSLHVQSLSYWAGANIGPYSQSITTGHRAYIAGQIALLPSSLTLPPPSPTSYTTEVALSLQHVRRIVSVSAREARWPSLSQTDESTPNAGCEGGVCWIGPVEEGKEWWKRVEGAREGWKKRFGEEEKVQPLLLVQAGSLPKGALVEWQVVYGTGTAVEEEDSDEEEIALDGEDTWTEEETSTYSYSCSASLTSPSQTKPQLVTAILACNIAPPSPADALRRLSTIHSIKAFHRPSVPSSAVRSLALTLFGSEAALSTVAVDRIASLHGEDDWDVGFVLSGVVSS